MYRENYTTVERIKLEQYLEHLRRWKKRYNILNKTKLFLTQVHILCFDYKSLFYSLFIYFIHLSRNYYSLCNNLIEF